MKKFLAFLLIAFIFCVPENNQTSKEYVYPSRLRIRSALTWIKSHGILDLFSYTYKVHGYNAAIELCKRVYDGNTCKEVIDYYIDNNII